MSRRDPIIINYCTNEGGQNKFDIIKSDITSAKESVAIKNIGFDRLTGAKLIHAIADERNLIQAYEAIRSKPGNITAAVTIETLDGIKLE